MDSRYTFSEAAEQTGLKISTISKWYSEGRLKSAVLERNHPGGPTYFVDLNEIEDLKNYDQNKNIKVIEEIAAAIEPKSAGSATRIIVGQNHGRPENRHPQLVKKIQAKKVKKPTAIAVDGKHISLVRRSEDLVVKVKEESIINAISSLMVYFNGLEKRFTDHVELQNARNLKGYKSLVDEHLTVLKSFSEKMDQAVTLLSTLPQQLSEDTVKTLGEIKTILPNIEQINAQSNANCSQLSEMVKKIDNLSDEIKETKWAVVKISHNHPSPLKTAEQKGKMSQYISNLTNKLLFKKQKSVNN